VWPDSSQRVEIRIDAGAYEVSDQTQIKSDRAVPQAPDGSGPRVETWISSLMLSPREVEKLLIFQVAQLARTRRERGVKLNFPESIALISESLVEAARDGRSVAEAMEIGKQVLTRSEVMEGVPEMITLVQVEATFRTGTQLVSVANPIP
jgi:urease subunit gamma